MVEREGAEESILVVNRMLAEIHDDVHQGISHLTQTREVAPRVTISPDRPVATIELVDCPGEARSEMLDSPPEKLPVHRLDHEMDVVLLHAEMDDLKAIARRPLDSPTDRREDALLPKPWNPRPCSQNDMNRMILVQIGPRVVTLEAFAMLGRLPTRAGTASRPSTSSDRPFCERK
jgi:hypothetical protein